MQDRLRVEHIKGKPLILHWISFLMIINDKCKKNKLVFSQSWFKRLTYAGVCVEVQEKLPPDFFPPFFKQKKWESKYFFIYNSNKE